MCLCLLPVASSAVYRAAHSTPAPGLVATHTQSTEGSENLFDPTDPNGKFKLNMRVPYDKMVLRLILDEAGKRVGFHVDQMEYTPLSGARVLLHVIHRLTKKLDASVVKALGLLEESLDAHDRMLLHHSIAGSIEVQRAVVVFACRALHAKCVYTGAAGSSLCWRHLARARSWSHFLASQVRSATSEALGRAEGRFLHCSAQGEAGVWRGLRGTMPV